MRFEVEDVVDDIINFGLVRYREFWIHEVSVGIPRKLVWNSSPMK